MADKLFHLCDKVGNKAPIANRCLQTVYNLHCRVIPLLRFRALLDDAQLGQVLWLVTNLGLCFVTALTRLVKHGLPEPFQV